MYEEEEYKQEDGYTDPGTLLVSGDGEKMNVLLMANEMLEESSFCDVTFMVQGHIFRAHRIIVGGWSRWLRALLTESPHEDIISLDFLDPEAFSAVLKYMYGKPIAFTIEGAEPLLKVIRRLELGRLEDHCWQYMMTVIDKTNVIILHEFADRYDCPALKLMAWRMIQEENSAYAALPSHLLGSTSSLVSPGRSGMTGPAESFSRALRGEEEEEEEFLPSILQPELNSYEDEGGILQPDELPDGAKATDVVRAWANRLQDIWNQCNPEYIVDDDQAHQASSVNVDLKRELRDIYSCLNMPDKLNKIDDILTTFKGKEKQMLESILHKYQDILPADYIDRLIQVLNLL